MSSRWFQVRRIHRIQTFLPSKWARPTAVLLTLVLAGTTSFRLASKTVSVILDDLRQSPYSARIEFEKVYTNPADHTELKRERWTASVTYVFRENVKNNELAVNPLGLTIVRFRADQAFS
jgi:type IV secretory pathway TrbF-like protein